MSARHRDDDRESDDGQRPPTLWQSWMSVLAAFFVAGPRLVASFDRRGMVASFDRFAILGAEDAPVRRLDEVVVRTFGSAPRSAPVPSGRPSRYSRRRSESSPTFPIASMTYVPELGVVTTTPAFLNADIVRFHGSDWPGWCRPRCASPRFRRSRPGNCCRGRTGGREARGEIRVRYGIAPRFYVSGAVFLNRESRVRTTALGPTIVSASSTSALAERTCSGGIARTTSRPASVSTLAKTQLTAPSSGMVLGRDERGVAGGKVEQVARRNREEKKTLGGFDVGCALTTCCSPSTSARKTM